MKLRFVLAFLVLSLGIFLPSAKGDDVCVYDSDCDCSDVSCDDGSAPNATCCGDPSFPPNFCDCWCRDGSGPSCDEG